MQVKNFITFRMYSNAGGQALESKGAVSIASIMSKKFNSWVSAQDDDAPQYRACYSPVAKMTTVTDTPESECLLTCAELQHSDIIKDILRNSRSKYFLWFIGKSYIQKELQKATAYLEFLGYDLIFMKDTSTRLGIGYNDTRYFLIGKKGGELVLMPSVRDRKMCQDLSVFFNVARDPEAKIVDVNGITYQNEIRPWNHISIPHGNVLEEKKLGWRYGATYYAINGKCHRITHKECAHFLGQEDITFAVDRPITKVYYMLKEPPYIMWLDLIERML